MKLNLGELLKEMGIAGLVAGIMDTARDAVKDGVKKVGDATITKITKEMEEEYRDRLFAFIRSLATIDPYASAQLIRRHEDRQYCRPRRYGSHDPYVYGDENKFVKLLSKLYIGLDEPDEQNARVQIFIWLGHLSNKEFDSRLEFLNHDVVVQYIKRALGVVKGTINQLYSTDRQHPGLYQQVDRRANKWAKTVNKRTQNPSRFGRIARRLIR